MTPAIARNASLLSAQVGAIHRTRKLDQGHCGAGLLALRVLLVALSCAEERA